MEICTYHVQGTDRLGAPCAECGHSTVAHPGHYCNPSLDACLICTVLKHNDPVAFEAMQWTAEQKAAIREEFSLEPDWQRGWNRDA